MLRRLLLLLLFVLVRFALFWDVLGALMVSWQSKAASRPCAASAFGTRRTSESPVLQTLPSPSRPPNFALTLLFFAVFFFLLAVPDLPARLQCSPVDIGPILSPNADLTACLASREACLVRAASFAVDRLDCLPQFQGRPYCFLQLF